MTVPYRVERPEWDQITNWSGEYLEPSIRNLITIGHTVRVQLSDPADPPGAGSAGAYYATIETDTDGVLRGFVNDPYIDEETSSIPNDVHGGFAAADVIEVPLTWSGNETLKTAAIGTGRNRTVTGPFDDGPFSHDGPIER
ncbi:hypothetical protein [Curtobacterium pusillum]|uniref:hypothetical protein n=1 Tax=Curtobacterium pusillum TaxID=69373 RepID=UPI0011A7459E|nr:hypothetical protein [Curtobacterium pusillum]